MMQFLLYCLCGGIGVSTDFGVYYIAITQGVWYQVANIAGYISGTLVSFFLNRIITFSVRDRLIRRLLTFLGVASIGFLASAVFLWAFVDVVGINAKLAKLLTLPIVVVLQYLLNRRITFSSVRDLNSMKS